MHLIVPAVGLEPTLLSEPVPKTGASAVPPRGDNTAQTGFEPSTSISSDQQPY